MRVGGRKGESKGWPFSEEKKRKLLVNSRVRREKEEKKRKERKKSEGKREEEGRKGLGSLP